MSLGIISGKVENYLSFGVTKDYIGVFMIVLEWI